MNEIERLKCKKEWNNDIDTLQFCLVLLSSSEFLFHSFTSLPGSLSCSFSQEVSLSLKQAVESCDSRSLSRSILCDRNGWLWSVEHKEEKLYEEVEELESENHHDSGCRNLVSDQVETSVDWLRSGFVAPLIMWAINIDPLRVISNGSEIMCEKEGNLSSCWMVYWEKRLKEKVRMEKYEKKLERNLFMKCEN